MRATFLAGGKITTEELKYGWTDLVSGVWAAQ
jgi:hypothetical protein